jgi:hypothetical protein
VTLARALLILLLLAAPASAEHWSARDVEAAERYRTEERERAARYRAALEERAREAPEPAPRAQARTRERPVAAPGLGARLSDWLHARLAELLGGWLAAAEDWLVRQLDALSERFEAPPPRRDFRASGRAGRDPLADWVVREERRALRLLLDEVVPRSDPEAEREARRRDAERAREWARRRAREPHPTF